MARNFNLFTPVGRFFGEAASMISVARELQDIHNTPEHVFRARGTTRDAAIRAAAKRL
jgi:hypothetical protein